MTPPSTAVTLGAAREGLECLIGRARVALPMEAVRQIIEYDVTPPPPLARRWVGGLGSYQGQVLLSIALVPPVPAPSRPRATKGVLLSTPGSQVLWALEVNSVAAAVRVQPSTRRPPKPSDKLPGWISPVVTEDRRSLGWVDVQAMLQELSGDPPPLDPT